MTRTYSAPQGRAASPLLVSQQRASRRLGHGLHRLHVTGRGLPLKIGLTRGFRRDHRVGQRRHLAPSPLAQRSGQCRVQDSAESLNSRSQQSWAGTAFSRLGSVVLESDVLVTPCVLAMDHRRGVGPDNAPVIRQGLGLRAPFGPQSGVWIGAGTSVVSGCSPAIVGGDEVIGARAVVTRSMAPGDVIAGPRASAQ